MLDRLSVIFRSEPVLAVGLVSAFNGIIALFVPDEVTVAISAFNVALAAIVVRAIVMPVDRVVGAVTDAATAAATNAATTLGETSVGVVGELTGEGEGVVAGSISGAVADALRGVGINPRAAAA